MLYEEIINDFTNVKIIKRTNDDESISYIPESDINSDYQQYLAWLEEQAVT